MAAASTAGPLRLAVAQLDPVVGDFAGNVRKILDAYRRSASKGAELLITPELSVCGYPPHDLVERSEMFDRNEAALEELMRATKGQACLLAVGHVANNPGETGRAAQNCVTVLRDGKRVFRQAKTLLPTYDVFDETRYFEPADAVRLFEHRGVKIAFAICEDLWAHDSVLGRRLYGRDPVDLYREQGAELVISLSASPYAWGKLAQREALHAQAARALGAPLLYVNQVGATDEILFDGGSFAVDSRGERLGRLPFFRTSFGLVELEPRGGGCFISPEASVREDEPPADIVLLERALVTGIREYFVRTGFKSAVLGLSGGIDSAVVGALAVQALGAANVRGVAMPSQHSSGHSLEDAQALAAKLGIAFEVRPIKFLFSQAQRELSEGNGALAALAVENLQARLRGLILMTLSNHHGALVLTTGNKSELATGYCTMYGDMVGALAPLGDVLKTRVYALAEQINRTMGGAIPQRSIDKAPSAELRPDQKDQDTLPPYPLLDALLEDHLERGVPVATLQERYADAPGRPRPGWVSEILRKVELNEYKRRQAAPVLKVSPKAFGIGRRIPIAKHWEQG
jgi:NAD+ synthase (glutamine-hydrolysing)